MNIPAERRQARGREEPEMQKKEERGQVCKTILLIKYSILKFGGF